MLIRHEKAQEAQKQFLCALCASSRLNNLHFRNRHDELAAIIAIGLLLFENSVGEIAREQQRVIRFALEQFLRRDNWNVRARREPALLVSAAVGYELQRLRAHAKKIQQGAALRRRTVSADALAFRL